MDKYDWSTLKENDKIQHYRRLICMEVNMHKNKMSINSWEKHGNDFTNRPVSHIIDMSLWYKHRRRHAYVNIPPAERRATLHAVYGADLTPCFSPGVSARNTCAKTSGKHQTFPHCPHWEIVSTVSVLETEKSIKPVNWLENIYPQK